MKLYFNEFHLCQPSHVTDTTEAGVLVRKLQRWVRDIFFMVRYRWFDNCFPAIRLRQIEVFGNLQVR
jgi:hypothetical protein